MHQNTQTLTKDQTYTQIPSYNFAANQNFCPVFLPELPQLVREYFIIFPNNNTGLPHVLLGFEKNKNKYVAENGEWQADYVPAYIRRYPFTLAKVEGKDDYTLAADMGAPHFNKPGGEALFTADGKPGEFLQGRINLLKALENQRVVTQKAVKEIEDAGLFKMEQMKVKSGGQDVAAIGGLRMIDTEKLAQITAQPGPFLELIYAHLFSKGSLQSGVLAGKRKDVRKTASTPTDDIDIGKIFGEDDIFKF